jgi:hypothetical protein
MIVLIADVGSHVANSLVSLTRAEELISERLDRTAWPSSSDDDEEKKAALIRASRRINALPWLGIISYPAQRQSFPRVGLYRNTSPVDPTTIPIEIEYAVVDLAYQIRESDVLSRSLIAGLGITKLAVEDAVDITFDKSTLIYKPLPDDIMAEIPIEWLRTDATDEPFMMFEAI